MNLAKAESAERKEIVAFGMWLFLASEAMFFMAFFATALIMRLAHPELLNPRPLPVALAFVNSAVLALSVFFMARAVQKGKAGELKAAGINLFLTAGAGTLFLVVKLVEYAQEIREGKLPSTNIFFGCYYTLTGFEGLHVLIGIGVLLVLGWRARRGDFNRDFHSPLDVMGFYWYLLAVVWVFILLFFYLL
jgi:heme/copper-type cytochrome/quinol oxidase subunit 3